MTCPGAELDKLGIGSLSFWGFTPAYDLTEIMCKGQGDDSNSWHILLVGGNDARHILKTICSLKDTEREIHFYISECHPILLARQLLLLHVALLPLDKLGLHEKTTQFMEILGNILIRPQTQRTIKKACETLTRLVSDEAAMSEFMPIISLKGLKYFDRDAIVECYKAWVECNVSAAEMEEKWNSRLRQHLGTRYDAKVGVFDWDYHMSVVDKNPETKIIHASEFKTWRNEGQAFQEYESDYNQANPSYFYGQGQPYRGDILIGPFLPYGIKSDDKSLFEQMNDQYKKKSSEVTFQNLENIFSVVSPKTEAEGLQQFKKIKIHLLSTDMCETLWKRSNFNRKFDTVHVSSFMSHKLIPEMVKLIKLDGMVLVDKAKYIWYFRSENEEAYEKKILGLADKAGLDVFPRNNLERESMNRFMEFEVRNFTAASEEKENKVDNQS